MTYIETYLRRIAESLEALVEIAKTDMGLGEDDEVSEDELRSE